MRVWQLADGKPVGKPMHCRTGGATAVAVGALPGGTPVIVSADGDTVRVWRLDNGEPVGKPLRGHDGTVKAVAVGALPDDNTPIIVTGGGKLEGAPMRPGSGGRVRRALYGTVRVWRLPGGTPILPPLDLPAPVWDVAIYGDVIVTAAGADISVHQLARRPRRAR